MGIRIIIADDHGLLRAGLRALLNSEPDIEVVGEAADGREVLRLAEVLRPDVVLMDLSMPYMGGIEATRRLKELVPEVRVLVLTVHEDRPLLQEAIHAGAVGYIVKRAVEAELVNAIHAVISGQMYVHPTMMRALLLPEAEERETDVSPQVEELSPRETEVLRLIAMGYTNREMADRLTLSVRTVEYHRANVMGKLNLHSRVELVRYAARHGLLETENL